MLGFAYVQLLTEKAYMLIEICVMSLAGFILLMAFMCLNAALLSGKGALAISITQTQSFFWLILEIIIN